MSGTTIPRGCGPGSGTGVPTPSTSSARRRSSIGDRAPPRGSDRPRQGARPGATPRRDGAADLARPAIDLLPDEAFADLVADYVDPGDLFADGQVGVLWERVLPAWFRSLSPALEPDAWAEQVVSALRDFGGHKTAEIVAATQEIATPQQRQALATHGVDVEPAHATRSDR